MNARRTERVLRRSGLAVAVALAFGGSQALAQSLPTGGTVVGGSGAIGQSGATMTVRQDTQRMALNWQSFSIGAGNAVIFHQPSSSAVALNRVLGGSRSEIYGSLQANGQVFLINPNGVLFGKSAEVNVGGLFASTRSISDDDFMAGNYRFSGAASGEVINQGALRASEGGYIVLAADRVRNDGSISANGGSAVLAAARSIELKLDAAGKLGVNVEGATVNALVENGGLIQADGGQVLLTARGRDMLQASVMNLTGVVRARSIGEKNGVVVIDGGTAADAGNVVLEGATLDVSGLNAGETGGRVEITGRNVGLFGTTSVDARGDAGGGTVLVGGDWQGGGALPHAQAVVMGEDARIDASATSSGNGGTVVLWSDKYTGFYGEIAARGGAQRGDGGRVETSSLRNLQAMGTVQAGAASGAAGQWLLDPLNVTITNVTGNVSQAGGSFTPTASPATIDVATINSALNAGTAVTVDTGATGTENGDITVAAAIAKTAGAGTSLTLDAAGSIFVNANITSTSNALATTLNAAGGAVSGTGAINTNGGLLTVNAASGSGTLSGAISGTGSLTKTGAGTLTLSSNGNTYTGDTTIDGGRLVFSPSAIVAVSSTNFFINNASTLEFANTNRFDVTNAKHVYFDAVGGGTADFRGTSTNGGFNLQPGGSLTFHSQGGVQNVVKATSGPGINTGFGTVTLDVAAGGDGLLVSAPLWNTGSLVKGGAGLAVLTAANTLTGTTTVNAGVLQIGAGGVSGSISGSAATINAGGTLRWFRSGALTVANSTSGTGILEFLGTGVSANSDYVLGGNNSGFTGSVIIDRSRLRYDNANDLGAAAVITVLSGGQVLASANIPNAMNLNGTGWLHPAGTLGALRLVSGADASGNIVLQSDAHISAVGSTGTVSGVISGAGRALEIQRGTLTLAGANTFTGPLTLQNGTVLILAPTASLTTTTVNLGNKSLGGGSGDAILQHQADNQLMPNTILTFDGVGTDRGYWQLLGTSQSVAGIIDTVGASVIENAETQSGFGNGTITLTGSGTYSFGGFVRDKVSGTSGTLSVVKNGTGTQTIAGGNVHYTGATTVHDGTLVLFNTPAYRSATTVNTGATLELGGTIHMDHLAGFALALNDGATLRKTNAGYNTFNSSNVTVNGTVDIEVANSGVNNQLFIGSASTGLQGSGTINLTNTGSATTGMMLRSGPGSFSGTMNVNGGQLSVNAGAGLALENTTVNLSNAANFNINSAFGGTGTAVSVMSFNGDATTTSTFGGQTLTVGANNGSGSFDGVISGAGGRLAKTGTGTQILSGNNTYTGVTTISGGVLQIGNGGASGTLGTGAVTDNASLVFNRSDTMTVANLISGTGAVTQAGSGTTILTANNTYGGATTIGAGTLQVGNNGTTGTLGSGAVTNNGNLVFNRSNTVNLSTLASNAAGISGTGNVTALIGGGFAVDRDIALTGANSTILLEAGKNVAAGTATGGNVTLNNNVSTSASGTVTIFSGNASTAAYEARISGATGATRYKTYNASAADTGSAVSGTRNYYYRQAPGPLSVSGLAGSKTYDGLVDALAALDGSAAVVNGLLDGDALSYAGLTPTAAAFGNAHAGSRTITASFNVSAPTYSGGGAMWSVTGYSAASIAGSGAGTITPKQLTTSINAVGKTYDGTTVTSSTFAPLSGFAGNDSGSLSGLTLAFDDPNAGTRNVVASGSGGLSGFVGAARGNGSGVGAGNEIAGFAGDYVVIAPASASAVIAQAPLTVRANNDAKIVTQADAAGYNGASYSGFVNGETTANLGGALSITRSNAGVETAGNYGGVLVPAGQTSGNYAITYVSGDYRILPAEQLLVRVQNVTNTYGAAPAYVVTSVQYLDSGGSTIHTLTQTAHSGNTYSYSDGAGGSVTFTVAANGAVLSSAGHVGAGNYALTGTNTSISGSNFVGLNYVGNHTVDQAALTPGAGGVSKVYDGTTAMGGLTVNLAGLLIGDSVLANGSGAFSSKNAGSNLSYTVSGLSLSGADAGNYYLAGGAGFSGNDGVITPRPIDVTGIQALNKVYDGTLAAQLNTGAAAFVNSIAGDDLSLASASGAFADPFVGISKPVAISVLLGGADAANYSVNTPIGSFADITPSPAAPTAGSFDQALVTAQRAATEAVREPGARVDVTQSPESVQLAAANRNQMPSSVFCVGGGIRLPEGVAAPSQEGICASGKR